VFSTWLAGGPNVSTFNNDFGYLWNADGLITGPGGSTPAAYTAANLSSNGQPLAGNDGSGYLVDNNGTYLSVTFADYATNAINATYATDDEWGNEISNTYINGTTFSNLTPDGFTVNHANDSNGLHLRRFLRAGLLNKWR